MTSSAKNIAKMTLKRERIILRKRVRSNILLHDGYVTTAEIAGRFFSGTTPIDEYI